jgi:heme oxygenase
MIDNLINNLVSHPTLHALRVSRGSFEDRHQYDDFLRNIPGFQRNLHHYFVAYCQKSRQLERLTKEHISIKGYYFGEAAMGEDLIIIYAELKALTNKDSVLGLYHWEDKLNELRTSNNTDGVQGPS